MTIIKNEGTIDRGARLLLAELFFITGFFWFGGVVQMVLFVLSFVMLATAATGFCGLYKLVGVNTCAVTPKPASRIVLGIFTFIFIAVAIGGSYASIFFSKKFFLEDYNAMNEYYKQTLFLTGQEKRAEAVFNYEKLVPAFASFRNTYETYHPYTLAGDPQLNADLEKLSAMIALPKAKIVSGDLKSAHLDLEQVRPIFQNILKRNGFSMLAVTLVDFHDAMEKIIAASDAKDSALVISTYTEVSGKLGEVEGEANDAEIQAIRQNLDQLLQLAKDGSSDALSAKAAELKSSFVKVYLKRG